ncbi:MAG TPA: AMP-binding protein, partial [Devosia sp.]|nr:AMP-binding protein [Devosia sp.]
MLGPYPQWKTIAELLRARAQARPADLAISIVGNSLTYAELDRLTDRVGANLAALGVKKGDRVASFAYNCIEQVLVWFGCMKIGAIWVPFNVALIGSDLKYTLEDAAPKVIVADSETRPRIDALFASGRYDIKLF